MEKVKGFWKVLAIVFIVLTLLLGLVIVWAWSVGTHQINQESVCAMNVCNDYLSYQYDAYAGNCYCFDNNGLVAFEKYIG